MSVEIVGKFPSRQRTITGLYSLDHAFINDENELGFPVGHGNELFGLNYIGKSTFALGLSGILAKAQNENISFADLEGFDRNHLVRIMDTVGYDGKVYIPTGATKVPIEDVEDLDDLDDTEDAPKKRKPKEEKEYDEIVLDELITDLRKKNCAVGILDSIGAISPISETEGDIGEANMGRRGLVMAQFSRKTLKLCRSSKTPKTILMLNHWYPKLGGRGYSTPGGEVKRYLTSVQILLKQHETFPDKSYVLEGTVKKNRWGYPGKQFYVFMLAGCGVHLGLSAMYDCLIYKKATRHSKIRGTGVKIDDKKFTITGLTEEAKAGNNEIFTIFRDALSGVDTAEFLPIDLGMESSSENTDDQDNSTD
jgi:RecA/RadA recombinase